MDFQQDREQHIDYNENDGNKAPKFTRLFLKAMNQFRLRVFFLFLEKLYIIISISIILVLLSLQDCGWNDLHYWAAFCLIFYGQLFDFSNIESIQQHLAFHYFQIAFVPINEVTDPSVAPEVFDPTANLITIQLEKGRCDAIINKIKDCQLKQILQIPR